MTHRMDMHYWCERCGLSAMAIVEGDLRCAPPDADVLADRRLASIVARAPLARIVDQVVARLEDSGRLP